MLVYRIVTYFLTLILCPTTLLNYFIGSNSFLVESFGFSRSRYCHLQMENFTSSFLIWMPFISFFCLTALTTTSSTIWNRSGNSEHSCLVPKNRGKTFSFSSLSTMLAVGLSYYVGVYSFIYNLLKNFIMKGC